MTWIAEHGDPGRRPCGAHGAVRRTGRCSAPGLTLLEVLVMLLVLTLGLAAIVRLQAHLHHGAEVARQRAAALLHARNEIEALRSFARIGPADAADSYAAIGPHGPIARPGDTAAVAYELQRDVVTHEAPRLKHVTVTARWSDRHGQAQQLELATLLAGLAPETAGWTLLAPGEAPEPVAWPARHPAVPASARGLGDGRAVFHPQPGEPLAWVFDLASGLIVAVCEDAGGAPAPNRCRSTVGLLVSGHVRFATAAGVPDPRHPRGMALPLDLCLAAADAPACTGAALAECFDDAPAAASPARADVTFHCAVFLPSGADSWSGRLNLVPLGWPLGPADLPGPAYRACRYSADRNANGRIDNAEHPAFYRDVTTPLTDQNFLVVRAAAPCPADPSTAPDNPASHSTAAHQP